MNDSESYRKNWPLHDGLFVMLFFENTHEKTTNPRHFKSFDRIHHHATLFIDPSKDNINMPYYLGKKTNSVVKKTAY